MFRARTVIPVLAAVAIFASAPALAQDHSARIFFTANWVSPLGDDEITFGSVEDAVQGSDDFGFEGGFEGRFNKVFGLEGSLLVGSNEFELGDDELGDLDQRALTLALNFHIIPTKFFDLWLAPVVSWYSFGELDDISDDINADEVDINDDWGYGAQVGFDIGFGKTFAITGGVRYIKLDVGGDDFDPVAFDPVIARLGVAFRFGGD